MKPYLIVLFVSFATAPVFCAEDRQSEELKRIIRKALNAHGGEDKLKRLTSFVETTESRTAKGLVSTQKRYVQLPNDCRSETEFGPDSTLKPCVIVQTRDRRWRKLAGEPTRDLGAPSEMLRDAIRFAGPRIVLQLVDPQSTVTLIGQAKVGDTDVIGVKVKSRFEERWFFDTESDLLVKRETAAGSTFYTDYQKADGIPIARQITQKKEGKVYLTTKVIEFKVVDRHDPTLFEKP